MLNKLTVVVTVLLVCGLAGTAQDRVNKIGDPPKVYPAYQVGDRVEAYNYGWHAGVVTQIGSGKNQGDHMVKYDKWKTQEWIRPDKLRSAAMAEAETAETVRIAATASLGPRVGKYNIFSYGAPGTVRLYLGHVEIMSGGKYRVSRTSEGNHFGEGTYTFDAAAKRISWSSGPYATAEWGGAFSVTRNEHQIKLRSGTIAVN